jgi:hypothetical protein
VSLHPTNELVAVAWLKGVTDLGGRVATELPADEVSWADGGFVQVTGIGGSPERTMPVAKPVVSLDFWACAPGSGRPPWGKANQLAEHVRADVHAHATTARTVTLPSAYSDARVITAYLLTEPRRVRSDVAYWAHYTADLHLSWVELT